jgi:hypothetical protein
MTSPYSLAPLIEERHVSVGIYLFLDKKAPQAGLLVSKHFISPYWRAMISVQLSVKLLSLEAWDFKPLDGT